MRCWLTRSAARYAFVKRCSAMMGSSVQGRGAPVMLILTRRGLDWVLTDVGVEPEKKGQKF